MEGFITLQNLQEIMYGAQQKLCAGACDVGILYQIAIVGVVILGMFFLGGLARRGLAQL